MHNLLYGFDIYLVNVKTIRQIKQIFVAFSEKLNFIKKNELLIMTRYVIFLDKKVKILEHCGLAIW